MTPIRPDLQAGFWYLYYFVTERGRAGLTANRREIAKVIWTRNSPNWRFDDATLESAITLDGLADGNFPATDGGTSARCFTGPRVHHQVPNAGHNLPQESPGAFAGAVLEVADLRSRSGAV